MHDYILTEGGGSSSLLLLFLSRCFYNPFASRFFKIVKNGNTGIEENKQSAKLYPTYAKDKINTTESDIIRVNAIDLTGLSIFPCE